MSALYCNMLFVIMNALHYVFNYHEWEPSSIQQARAPLPWQGLLVDNDLFVSDYHFYLFGFGFYVIGHAFCHYFFFILFFI